MRGCNPGTISGSLNGVYLNMTSSMEAILNVLPRIRDEARGMQDIVLANLVAIGEVPAPYQHEEGRVRMMLERFSECGLQSCSADATGNGLAILPDRRHSQYPPVFQCGHAG